jgi:hypothetical protein
MIHHTTSSRTGDTDESGPVLVDPGSRWTPGTGLTGRFSPSIGVYISSFFNIKLDGENTRCATFHFLNYLYSGVFPGPPIGGGVVKVIRHQRGGCISITYPATELVLNLVNPTRI